MKKILKWAAIVLGVGFLLIQFVRPARTNPVVDQSLSLRANSQMTPEVEAIFKRACLDCHSNETVWPWYSNIAPVSWLVVDDVNEAREHWNFSEWGKYDSEDRADLLEEMCEEVEKGAMPLKNYVLAHSEAKLSAADIRAFCEWTEAEHERAKGEEEAEATEEPKGKEEGKGEEPGGRRRRGRGRR